MTEESAVYVVTFIKVKRGWDKRFSATRKDELFLEMLTQHSVMVRLSVFKLIKSKFTVRFWVHIN